MGWVGTQGYLNPSQARILSGDRLNPQYVYDPLAGRFRSFLYCLASCLGLASIIQETVLREDQSGTHGVQSF